MITDYLPDNSGSKTIVETRTYRLGLRDVEIDEDEKGRVHELQTQLAPGIRARSWAKLAVQIGQLNPADFKKVKEFLEKLSL